MTGQHTHYALDKNGKPDYVTDSAASGSAMDNRVPRPITEPFPSISADSHSRRCWRLPRLTVRRRVMSRPPKFRTLLLRSWQPTLQIVSATAQKTTRNVATTLRKRAVAAQSQSRWLKRVPTSRSVAPPKLSIKRFAKARAKISRSSTTFAKMASPLHRMPPN